MKTASLLWFALLLPAMSASAGQPAATVLRVWGQESLPPKWILHDDHAEGVCPDILAAIESVEPRLRFSGMADLRSLPAIEQGLAHGSIDCSCALLDTAYRRKIAVVAGDALYQVRRRLAAAAGDTAVIDNLNDLVKMKPLIATARGAGYSEELRALGLEVDDSTGDNLINLKKIIAGHGRFFYMNELSLNWIVRENGMADKVRILPAVLGEEPVYFWVSKKTAPSAARLVDRALLKLKANGELERIYERWAAER